MFKKNLNHLLAASLVALSLTLGACGDAATVAPAITAANKAGSTAGAVATGAATSAVINNAEMVKSIASLNEKLLALNTAVAANDFAKAKTLVTSFDDSWGTVEDAIKAKSPDAYKNIEDKIDGAKDAIVKPTTPDPAKSKQAVKELTDALNQFSVTLTK